MNPNQLISQVLGITAQNNENLVAGQEALGQVSQQMAQSSDAIQAAGLAQIEAQGQAAKQRAAANYVTNIVHQKAQYDVGLDPDQINNELKRSLASINEAKAVKDAQLAEWNNLQQVDFMSNPVGYILNQLKSDGVAQRFQAAEALESEGYANVQKRTQLLNQVKTSVAANTADTLNEAALADAQAKRSEAEITLLNARQGTLSKQGTLAMQQLEIAMKVGGNKMDAVKMVNLIQEQTENQALRKLQMAATQDQRRLNNAQLELVNEEKQARAQAKLNARMQVDAAGKSLGIVNLTPEAIDSLKDRTKAEKITSVANTMKFGPTIAEGVRVVADIGNVPVIRESNPGLYDFLKKASGTVYARETKLVSTRDPITLKPPTAEEARTKVATSYQNDVEASVSNPKAETPVNSPVWDTDFNPLRAQYMSMADLVGSGKLPALSNNVVTSTVKSLLPTRQGGDLAGADETMIFNTIAAQVKSGSLLPVDAAVQVKQYYDTAARHGLELFSYDRFNMPMPRNYYIQLGNGLPAVDLRSVASLEAAFARQATKAPNPTDFRLFGIVGEGLGDFLRGYPLPK